MDDQVFQLIMDKMNKLESKVDDVLKFKFQIMGVTAVASLVIGVIVQILIAKYGK